MVANICIERQILAYHKNLLSVTCPSISQLSCILPPPHKKTWQIERKITVITTWEVSKITKHPWKKMKVWEWSI